MTFLVASLGACGGEREALGGGPEVDVCGGYEAYDELPEPDAADAGAVREWATGFLRVIERTETDDDVTDANGDRHEVPAPVAQAFADMERSVTAMRDRVGAAGEDATEVRRAADSLATDETFRAADTVVRDFHAERCE